MPTSIAGLGTALPTHSIGAPESVEYALDYFAKTDEQRRQLPLLYRMAGVKRRYSVLLDAPEGTPNRQHYFPRPESDEDAGPTMRERMATYEAKAPDLAEQSSRAALQNASTSPEDITHLITVSCSGFAAPSVDIALINRLGLKRTTVRTHVGFMGCHGAFNGMRVAKAFCDSDPNARVLLCAVELCSLHYHYGWDPEQLVANALFADGSAAVVCTGESEYDSKSWKIAASGSCLIPESEDAMTWRLGNNGFIMSLSARVPELIASHLYDWMTPWLESHGLTLEDIKTWAIHPGGPRILTAASKALSLPPNSTDVSKEILQSHGNMSSPTILFILDRIRQQGAERPCVALGFGPGLVAEAVLFV